MQGGRLEVIRAEMLQLSSGLKRSERFQISLLCNMVVYLNKRAFLMEAFKAEIE